MAANTTKPFGNHNNGAGSSGAQGGHDIVVTTTVELLGVAVFTALAGMDDDLGKVLVVVMWGAVLAWLLLNIATFSGWINKA